eukprot:2597643-Pleurochrysis_carterae.AAC.2
MNDSGLLPSNREQEPRYRCSYMCLPTCLPARPPACLPARPLACTVIARAHMAKSVACVIVRDRAFRAFISACSPCCRRKCRMQCHQSVLSKMLTDSSNGIMSGGYQQFRFLDTSMMAFRSLGQLDSAFYEAASNTGVSIPISQCSQAQAAQAAG